VDRRLWIAIVAKAVCPMDEVRAGVALASMLPLLKHQPDDAFTEASAIHVCREGKASSGYSDSMPAIYGPLTNVPTFGVLDAAITRWWRQQRTRTLRSQPEPRPALPPPQAEPRTPEAQESVQRLVSAFAAERSYNQPGVSADAKPPKARTASDATLLALYRRDLAENPRNSLAATRIAMLTRKARPRLFD